MTKRNFIREHRDQIDRHIRQRVPNIGSISNRERELWLANDEFLYNWARSEGVQV